METVSAEDRTRGIPTGTKGRISTVIPWALYDFANSLLIINGGLYFSQWLVVDNKVSDGWFNMALSLSSVAILIAGPWLGMRVDRTRNPFRPLTGLTATMFLLTLVLFFATSMKAAWLSRIVVAIACFIGINFAYQLSLVVYHSLMGRLVPERLYGRVSGVGMAAGWIGCIVGLGAVLPFVQGRTPFFPAAGRANAFLPAAVLFALVAWPSLAGLRYLTKSGGLGAGASFGESKGQLLATVRMILRDRRLLFFYLFLFWTCDALVTIQANMPIYFDRVMLFGDAEKAAYIAGFLFASSIGAVICGVLADKKGLRPVLLGNTAILTVSIICLAGVSGRTFFTALWTLIAFCFGAVWALSRALLTVLTPDAERGRHFGIYTAFDRIGALLGPAVWSAALVIGNDGGSRGYKIALATLGCCLLPGFLFLSKCRMDQPAENRSLSNA